MRISAVIITYNEELNIDRCLSSLAGVVDEIVVVDSFSTDETKTICEKHGAVVVEKPFLDYSSSKNYGNSLAKGDYILSIDADEALSDELKQSILDLKTKPVNELVDSYVINRLTNYCGEWIYHCGWYPDKKPRLFRKDKAKWEGIIHEELIIDTKETKELDGHLFHYSITSIADHVNRINKYSNLSAEKLFKKGKKSSILHILIKPRVKFLKSYIFKLGFLDGYYGYTISRLSAYETFLRYSKLKELSDKN